MLLTVSPIIKDEMEWPNVYFIPEDACDILFFKPGVDLADVEANIAIEDTLALGEIDVFGELRNLSYGAFIAHLVSCLQSKEGRIQ